MRRAGAQPQARGFSPLYPTRALELAGPLPAPVSQIWGELDFKGRSVWCGHTAGGVRGAWPSEALDPNVLRTKVRVKGER